MASLFEKLKNLFTADKPRGVPEPPLEEKKGKETPVDPPRAVPKKEAPGKTPPTVEKPVSPKAEKTVSPPKDAIRKAPKTARKKKTGQKPSKAVNKHGIPVFEKETDFSTLFQEEPAETSRPRSKSPKTPKPNRAVESDPEKPRGKFQRVNKHGIPIFGKETDFQKYFQDADDKDRLSPASDKKSSITDAEKETENFEELLEKSIFGKNREHLILEKTGGITPERPPTRKEKIAAYPPPQGEIDLHGCTGEEAMKKTEAFIRESRRRGKRTVVIIVGKGIHSKGRPVLPDLVEIKLAELRQKNWVLAAEWERGRKRKSGSVIVYLKTPLH